MTLYSLYINNDRKATLLTIIHSIGQVEAIERETLSLIGTSSTGGLDWCIEFSSELGFESVCTALGLDADDEDPTWALEY
jgi:hypothetical protein